MATRWMRWNETTHVFENSVDGVTFNPLPLNASCLEGTIPPGTLPGGGGGGNLTGDNIWTGLNTYSGVAPVLRFNETDGAANAKNWEVGVDTALFRVRTLNDALAAAATLLSIDRNGNLTVSAVASGLHTFSASADAPNFLHMVNTNAGVSAQAGMMMQNNVGDGRGVVTFTSSGNTSVSHAPDALSLWSAGAGGVSVNAVAGPIVIKTANTARVTVAVSGAVSLSGALTVAGSVTASAGLAVTGALSSTGAIACGPVTSSGAIIEYSRAVALGHWIDVPYTAGNFTGVGAAWTVEAADQVQYTYTIIGRTAIVRLKILAATTGNGATELRVTLPFTAVGYSMVSVHYSVNGEVYTGIANVRIAPGLNYLSIKKGDNTGLVSNVNVYNIEFQIAIAI